jgi:DNA-binding MarR family transcriptional regulator
MSMAATTRFVTLLALVRESSRLMVEDLVDRLHDAGFQDITAAHQPVFENIDRDGTRLTVLAARSGKTHQTMGELVQGLERRGYLERRRDPADGRARVVHLTTHGRALVRRAIAEIEEIEAGWIRQLKASGCTADVKAMLDTALRARHAGSKSS